MKKLSSLPLILAFAAACATGASAAHRKSSVGEFTGGAPRRPAAKAAPSGAIASGKPRTFASPAEIKANTAAPVKNAGGAPTSAGSPNGGQASSSGPQGFSFGHFARPLKAPVIIKTTTPQAKP